MLIHLCLLIHFKFVCLFVCLFDLILDVPLTIFQLNRDGSSWVEPVLSLDKCVLLKDHNAVTPVRFEPAAPRSRVKHSTTEQLRPHFKFVWKLVCKTVTRLRRASVRPFAFFLVKMLLNRMIYFDQILPTSTFYIV